MNESKIQQKLKVFFEAKGSLTIPNIYWFDRFESDLVAITRSDMLIECEIKCSKYDYLNDFRKKDKHELLEQAKDYTVIPNYFYFVSPEGLIDAQQIPDYTGLIHICKSGMNTYCKIVAKAPRLHNEKIDPSKWKEIAKKLAYRI